MDATRKSIVKLVFGIAIPLLIMVVTMVMVGMSFAWFSDTDKVTITEITMSTEEAYKVSFGKDKGALCKNLQYMGQTALTKSGYLMSKETAGDNTILKNDRAYYFVNVVSLDTLGKKADIKMSFDSVKIYNVSKDEDGNVVNDGNGNPIVTTKVTYDESHGNVADIPFVFTWFFAPHAQGEVGNYYVGEDGKNHVIHLDPTIDSVWYTPYGRLAFDESGKVKSVNGTSIAADYSIKEIDGTEITGFETSNVIEGTAQLFDFYIVFAPEKLFWMQYFAADNEKDSNGNYTKGKYTIAELYGDNKSKALGSFTNQMYYSGMEYFGSTFEFSAVIDVVKLNETA